MSISAWIETRVAQIASLTQSAGGGSDTTKIDSNKEFSCLSKLLANCTTDPDRKFINDKMNEYLKNVSHNHHFEKADGTSYNEVIDSTKNRMYVVYDEKGSMDHITTTRVDKKSGAEVTDEIINVKNGASIFK